MKVEILVVADVDWCEEDKGTPLPGSSLAIKVERSVEAAIFEACRSTEAMGYPHPMSEELSIQVDYTVARIVP